MAENILNITETQFLGHIMHEVKGYAEEYNITAIKALNEVLSQQFYYSETKDIKCTRLSKREYNEAFYSFIMGESTYFDFIPNEYFNLIFFRCGYRLNDFEIDEGFFEHLVEEIREHNEAEKRLKADTAEAYRILNFQFIPENVGEIFKLVNRYKLEEFDISFILVNLYSYGFIQGIRSERAKRKMNTIKSA